MAVNLGITHLPLGPMLQTEWASTFVEHDARAAALWLSAQAADGSADTPTSLAFLAIGTGISAGVVLDEELLRGDNDLPAKWAMSWPIPTEPSARAACGVASKPSPPARRLVGRPMRRWLRVVAAVLSPHSDAADVFRAGSAGDEAAVEITERVADHLAREIRSLVLTLGVKRVVIGGGVAAAGPALLGPIRSRIAHERAASPPRQAALGDVIVELLSPARAPGARGAAAIARHRINPLCPAGGWASDEKSRWQRWPETDIMSGSCAVTRGGHRMADSQRRSESVIKGPG